MLLNSCSGRSRPSDKGRPGHPDPEIWGGGGRDAGLQKKVFQQCHTLKFYPEPIRLLALYKSGRSWAPWKACPRLPHPQTFPGLSGDWGTRAHDKPSEISEKCAREMTGMTGDKCPRHLESGNSTRFTCWGFGGKFWRTSELKRGVGRTRYGWGRIFTTGSTIMGSHFQ